MGAQWEAGRQPEKNQRLCLQPGVKTRVIGKTTGKVRIGPFPTVAK